MTLPRDIHARRYYRVALQRLEEAKALHQLGYFTAASYLGGYSVECILKALVIVTTANAKRFEVIRSFRGQRGHDLAHLHDLLLQRRVTVPRAAHQHLARLDTWSVELRYDPGEQSPEDTAAFMHSCEEIVGWAKGRI